MKSIQLLKLIRTIVNSIVSNDQDLKHEPGSSEPFLVGLAWEIQQLLIKYDINEN